MQAVVSNLKLINRKKLDVESRFPKEVIPYLLTAATNADNKVRNEIENAIVKIGEAGIPILVKSLESPSGKTKAIAAMILIRLGSISIEPLKQAFKNNEQYSWVVEYIINEIEGTQKPLTESLEMQEVLAG